MSTGKPLSVAGLEAFVAAAHAALTEATPDVDEVRKQLSAARMVLAMFGHGVTEAPLDDVMKALNDGQAFVNGRSFSVKDVRLDIEFEDVQFTGLSGATKRMLISRHASLALKLSCPLD